MAKYVQLGKIEPCCHLGNEFLLQLIKALDEIRELPRILGVSPGDIAGIAVKCGSGVNQERTNFGGLFPRLVLIMKYRTVLVQGDDIAVG